MKKFFIVGMCILGAFTNSWAQKIVETNSAMSQGSNNALTVDLPGVKAKEAMKEWESYVKQFDGKTKSDKKTGEIFSDNAKMKAINGNNTIDIYAKAVDNSTGATLSVWFDLGGAFLSSREHAQNYPAAEQIVQKFSLGVSRGLIEEELKAEVKKQKELEEQYKDLSKEKDKMEKNIKERENDIEDYKKKIEKAKADIEKTKGDIQTNVGKQKDKQKEVDDQKEVVKKVESKLKEFKK